jgi:hypothetical protein
MKKMILIDMESLKNGEARAILEALLDRPIPGLPTDDILFVTADSSRASIAQRLHIPWALLEEWAAPYLSAAHETTAKGEPS